MTRSRGVNLSELMSDAKLRSEIAESIGQEGLARMSRLAEMNIRGYHGSAHEEREINEGLVDLALHTTFTSDQRELFKGGANWVLDSAAVLVADGARRLRLSPEARARILDSPQARDILPKLLERYRQRDQELVDASFENLDQLTGAFLRTILRGNRTFELTTMRAIARRAITAALRALELVSELPPKTPDLKECERQAALAELLDPLGVMIGLGDTRQGRGPDRFVGREDALRALRGIVDVLASESFAEAVGRTTKRASKMVTGLLGHNQPRMMIVAADGGMGKSTLIAKFLLDHALAPTQQFPFAVLDFDRAALEPRNPLSLLAEIARQVDLQFPDFHDRLDSFRWSIGAGQAASKFVDLRSSCHEFQGIVTEILNHCGANSFLVTLDTLELVELDPSAMLGVITLLRAMADTEFPQLCVVASGRSGEDELKAHLDETFAIESYALEAFTLNEARQMVGRLGERLLPGAWKSQWTKLLAGRKSDPPLRREPLTLRLAVEIVRDAKPETRDELVRRINTQGAGASAAFVGTLYEMRILDHIKSDHARKLAWPGLVARTVTEELAVKVLAPLCGLSADQARQGFKTLGDQGWIVERVEGVLRHRRDLRARTLPLMRMHDPKKFEAVLTALIDYCSLGNAPDEAEATYYRLLRGGKIPERDWSLQALRKLSNARGDFPKDSDAALLLEAANSSRPLSVKCLQRLPVSLLWPHFAVAGRSLRTFDDPKILPRVAYLTDAPPPLVDGPDQHAAQTAWQFLQIKCGHWDHPYGTRIHMPENDEDARLFGFYSSHMSLAGFVEPEYWAQNYPAVVQRISAERASKDWRSLAGALVTARLYDEKLAHAIDTELAHNPPRESRWGRSAEIGLRTLMLFAEEARVTAFGAWCAFEAQRVRDGLSRPELAMLALPLLEHDLAPRGSRLREELETPEPETDGGLVEDAAVLAELSVALETWGRREITELDVETVRRYCALREPEWIVPFGYLLHPHLEADWAKEIELDRLLFGSGGLFGLFDGKRQARSRPMDIIETLDLADRMGMFDPVLDRLVEFTGTKEHLILAARKRSRDAVRRAVGLASSE